MRSRSTPVSAARSNANAQPRCTRGRMLRRGPRRPGTARAAISLTVRGRLRAKPVGRPRNSATTRRAWRVSRLRSTALIVANAVGASPVNRLLIDTPSSASSPWPSECRLDQGLRRRACSRRGPARPPIDPPERRDALDGAVQQPHLARRRGGGQLRAPLHHRWLPSRNHRDSVGRVPARTHHSRTGYGTPSAWTNTTPGTAGSGTVAGWRRARRSSEAVTASSVPAVATQTNRVDTAATIQAVSQRPPDRRRAAAGRRPQTPARSREPARPTSDGTDPAEPGRDRDQHEAQAGRRSTRGTADDQRPEAVDVDPGDDPGGDQQPDARADQSEYGASEVAPAQPSSHAATVAVRRPCGAHPDRVNRPRVRRLASMSGILVAGTTSDAGKSVVTTGLCRALARAGREGRAVQGAEHVEQLDGLRRRRRDRPRPVGAGDRRGRRAGGGDEPGAAQAGQRPAQPRRGDGPAGRARRRPGLRRRAPAPRDRRRTPPSTTWPSRFDVVVAEGAGSPTEINLRASDYVNMGLARHAGLPTVVVGDIDRGGVFAAMFGTVALLEAADQALVAGFVVNKFRGDRPCSSPGSTELERLTGRRVYGVLPWHPELWLDSEDALDLAGRRAGGRPRDAQGRGGPAAADQQLHRRRRARPRAGPGRGLRRRPAGDLRRRPGRPARHPRDHRRPGLAARARPRPGGRAHAAAGAAGARDLRRLPDARPDDRRPRRRRGRARRGATGSGCSTYAPTSSPRRCSGCPRGAALGAGTTATRSTTAG